MDSGLRVANNWLTALLTDAWNARSSGADTIFRKWQISLKLISLQPDLSAKSALTYRIECLNCLMILLLFYWVIMSLYSVLLLSTHYTLCYLIILSPNIFTFVALFTKLSDFSLYLRHSTLYFVLTLFVAVFNMVGANGTIFGPLFPIFSAKHIRFGTSFPMFGACVVWCLLHYIQCFFITFNAFFIVFGALFLIIIASLWKELYS